MEEELAQDASASEEAFDLAANVTAMGGRIACDFVDGRAVLVIFAPDERAAERMASWADVVCVRGER